MKKGFTLIELLAVIVILAIIALIATPIILGIINDARKESNERSVELYASAVRNAIASYQLTHPTAPTKFSDLDVQYDGEVECAKEELYADGSFYIAECTVNGAEVDYTYGEQQITQVYKPQYYSWSSVNVGEALPDDAKTNVSELDTKGYPFYLGLDIDADGKVAASYVCLVRNETEYCLKGYDTQAYDTNIDIIKDVFSGVVDTDACFWDNLQSYCGADGLSVDVWSDGNVSVLNSDEYSDLAECYVTEDGNFACQEL